jgi:hypothetical protein
MEQDELTSEENDSDNDLTGTRELREKEGNLTRRVTITRRQFRSLYRNAVLVLI